jgi:VWFA-related protein
MPTGTGSGLYSQFTADQRMLRKAVASLRQAHILEDSSPARRGSSTQQAILEVMPALAEGRRGVPQAQGQGGTIDAAPLEDNDVRLTLSALNSAIQAMGRFSGRKIGVFLSEGIRTFKSNADTIMTETIHAAARANVIFYSIDPSGLDPLNVSATDGQMKGPADLSTAQIEPSTAPGSPPPSLPTSTGGTPTSTGTPTGPPGSAIAVKRADVFESQDALLRLAAETGGRFYRNNNDIKAGLTSLFQENSSYYLLGFQPESGKWDGKVHKLRVAVKGRPDLTVMSRKGYIAKAPAPKRVPEAKSSELIQAMYSPLVRRDIYVQVTPFFKDDSKRDPFLSTQIHIDAGKLTFREEGGKKTNKLLLTGFLMDANGRVVDQFNSTVNLSFEQKDFAEVKKEGLLITRNGPVKPGGYQYRVLVQEADTGMLGTAASYLDVPDLRKDFGISSIFTDAQLLQENKVTDAAGGASSMSQRRFPRSGQFAWITIIYNAKPGDKSKQPELEMTTRVMRNGQVVFSGKPKPVEVLEGSQPPWRIITGGIMQLGSLQPDEYTLEVTVVDKPR